MSACGAVGLSEGLFRHRLIKFHFCCKFVSGMQLLRDDVWRRTHGSQLFAQADQLLVVEIGDRHALPGLTRPLNAGIHQLEHSPLAERMWKAAQSPKSL
jgi:hypothetical protein